ncbi:MAG TPA: PHB depolymerase family esterase [Phycisphaerae bacterium]|nr:PHB depolymerase family esterase [Phycisphaerae bacterium]
MSRYSETLVAAMIILAFATMSCAQCGDHWLPGEGVSGINGEVYASTVWDPDGAGPQPPLLVVGGRFSTGGQLEASNIAAWDGSAWQVLGSGLGGEYPEVQALAVYKGQLIAAGHFTTAGGVSANHIALWDGATWQTLGSGIGGPPPYVNVNALTVYSNELIAGGYFTTAGGVSANHIARWDGIRWQALGSGIGSFYPYVSALAVYNGRLIAAGNFEYAGGISAKFIAQWNGSGWQTLGSGANSYVTALAVYNGSLVAAGMFTTVGGPSAKHIARWNGSAWQALGSGTDYEVQALSVRDTELIAGGDFTTAGGVNVNHIASWDGLRWQALEAGVGGGHPFSSVRALTDYNGKLSIGGDCAPIVPAGAIDLGRKPVPIHVPPSCNPAVPMPLIISLHGYSIRAEWMEHVLQFKPLADEYGFLYAYPEGTTDSAGAVFWNATDGCCNFYGSSADDSGYLHRVIEAIKAGYNVDPARVFLFGWSNGGFMCHRMACDHADIIAAIASFAGTTYKSSSACSPSGPVHVLHIHGTADPTVGYSGGSIGAGAVETVRRWAAYNGCSLQADTSAPPIDLYPNLSGNETSITRYGTGCRLGGSAELWTVTGGTHDLFPANRTRLVVEFLLAHPKPADCNGNGQPDDQDIAAGTSRDCNGNLVPDECEPGGVEVAKADFNQDCHVDMADFVVFAACFGGPTMPYASGCTLIPDAEGLIAADFDRDTDVDQDDFGIFQRCFSGTGKPADPDCAE